PNLLARTLETVEGGGIIVLLLHTMTSLKQLYSLTMDVHARFKTEGAEDPVVGRFNERFILSLGETQNLLVLDDQLNILPISSHMNSITPLPADRSTTNSPNALELKSMKESLARFAPFNFSLVSVVFIDSM